MSLKWSPTKFIDATVIKRAIPGNMLIQKSPLYIYSNPLPISNPKEGSVIGNPKPKKLNVASSEIACAVCNVPTTINGARQFGKMCLNIILVLLKAKHLAESMYSLLISTSAEALAVLA